MPSPRYVNVCGTGHRRLTDDQMAWLYGPQVLPRALEWLGENFGTEWIISGMALKFDQLLADQAKGYGFKLHAVIPFKNQDARWTAEQSERWHELLDAADKVTDAGRGRVPESPRQAAAMLHARNDAMFNTSQAVIACWDRTQNKGGTWSAVNKAVQRRLPILWIDPRARTVRPTRFSDWADILSSSSH